MTLQLARQIDFHFNILSHSSSVFEAIGLSARLSSVMFLLAGLGDGWGMKPALTRRPEILKELGSHLLQTLDGFIFVLSADGKIM